jgi:redox-sensitive bicupin YhaK (pirin superfamily)
LPRLDLDNLEATVLVGEVDGHASAAHVDTPLVGCALSTHGNGASTLPMRSDFEHGVVVLEGAVTIDGQHMAPGELVYLGVGRDELTVGSDERSRLLLLGGRPFHEEIFMWWNFVARTQEEAAQAWSDWNKQSGRFGRIDSTLDRIDAPTPLWLHRSD